MAIGLCGEQLCDTEGCLEGSEYHGACWRLVAGDSRQHRATLTTGKGLNLMPLKTEDQGHKGHMRVKAKWCP